MSPLPRREWLKQSALAAIGLGISLKSIAGEEYIPKWIDGPSGLINLGANENPYGISPLAKTAIKDLINLSNRYSFNVASLETFRKDIANYYKVSEDQVLITPGSGEGLKLLARHFSNGNLVTATPTFGILPNTAKKIGTEVIEIPLNAEKVHDLDAILKAINTKTALVYICNPANPTATIVSPLALKNFCIEASKKTVVLIDEAYIDFLTAPDNESMIGLIENHPNLLVTRTFSKIHAMAGLRIGFLIGQASLIGKLEEGYFQNSQFAVSNLSAAAAMASLKDETHRNNSREKNAIAREFTYKELTQLQYKVIPSKTNFMFFQLPGYKGNFAEDMMKKNILLRSSNYPDGHWARVSIGLMSEMESFISEMRKMRK